VQAEQKQRNMRGMHAHLLITRMGRVLASQPESSILGPDVAGDETRGSREVNDETQAGMEK
jgi:hypothetical protein